jgi:hypothetical protein
MHKRRSKMKKLILMLTLMAFVVSAPMAMAIDVNWDSIRQIWNAQQGTEKAADKKAKADQEQAPVTDKAKTPASDAGKTK